MGAAGEAGVAGAIEIIRRELETSVALTGVRGIGDVGPHILVR